MCTRPDSNNKIFIYIQEGQLLRVSSTTLQVIYLVQYFTNDFYRSQKELYEIRKTYLLTLILKNQ